MNSIRNAQTTQTLKIQFKKEELERFVNILETNNKEKLNILFQDGQYNGFFMEKE